MAIVTEYLSNFTGGEVDLISSLEADETQWLMLKGFVFDNARRIRSQWPSTEWDAIVGEDLEPEPEE
jgi:hypothetical protein